MELLDTVYAVLRAAEFRVKSLVEGRQRLYFENDSVLGFVVTYDSVNELLTNWRESQDDFLRENSIRLRQDRNKAWNVYSVLLTTESVSQDHRGELAAIEEEFRSTRKIARANVTNRGSVYRALSPILQVDAGRLAVAHDPNKHLTEKLTDQERRMFELLTSDRSADDIQNEVIHDDPEVD